MGYPIIWRNDLLDRFPLWVYQDQCCSGLLTTYGPLLTWHNLCQCPLAPVDKWPVAVLMFSYGWRVILDTPVIQVKMKFSPPLQSSRKKKQCCFYYVSHKTFIVPIVVLCWCLNITTEYAVLANKMSTCWLRSYSCYDEIKKWKHDKHCLLDFITLSLCGANVSSLRINNLNCWELIQRHLSLSKNCNFHLTVLHFNQHREKPPEDWSLGELFVMNGQWTAKDCYVSCPCVIICTYKNSCNRITVKTITNHHCNWLD